MTGECATYKAICANLSMTKGGGGVGDVWCKITESELKKQTVPVERKTIGGERCFTVEVSMRTS